MAQLSESHVNPGAGGRTPPLGAFGRVWGRAKDFSGLGGDTTYLWPRWMVLRAVGMVYVFIFAGIIDEAQVLIGPRGLVPLGDFFAQLHQVFPLSFHAFLRAPTLFWAGTGPELITALAWGGLFAAMALVLNLWPRMALFGCWLILLSFVVTWGVFSGSQIDQLMLETALLCIPFAPAGLRPGLGASSPPRPMAVFMMRWLLFRIMLESGLVKLIAGDPHWRDFTAMDVMHERSPFPTMAGYLDQQLPHAWHLGEIALTYAAEIAAPMLAVFGGRRGRWAAFILWTVFQAGIQLTNNFGWLNLASAALGLLLLDDQMLLAAARKLRLHRVADFLAARPAEPARPAPGSWRTVGLRAALWTHFCLAGYLFVILFWTPVQGFPLALAHTLENFPGGFHSINAFTLFAKMPPPCRAIEFEGSNDGGRTWRAYEFRYLPQREDRMCPFIAPGYPRFEATLQIVATHPVPSPLYRLVAEHLLQRDPAVMGLFRSDPFPDRPPRLIRMPAYALTFTDMATHRRTGAFWRKEPKGEYLKMEYLDRSGQVMACSSLLDEAQVMAGMGNAESQRQLGVMYLKGAGVAKDPGKAAEWLHQAAEQGEAEAQAFLGMMYATGTGVPRDEIEGLAWFNLAAGSGNQDAARNRRIAADAVGPSGVAAAELRSQALAAAIAAGTKSR